MKRAAASPLSPPTLPRRRLSLVLALSAVPLVIIAFGWHLTAISAYRATEAPGPTARRLADARLAATLEPWDTRFVWREITLRGLSLFESGRIDAAFWVLQPYARIVRADALYRSVYQTVVAVKTPLDFRKAHLQHAREQAGGGLRPQDVFH